MTSATGPPAVAVLAGGLSLERDVSLRSGRRVAEALADRGHRVTRFDLDDDLVPALERGSFDVAFLALHGKAGEDGTIQGLLDLLGTPYTGSGPLASALAWDKVVFKGLLRRAGVATPDWLALNLDAVRDMGAARALHRVAERLGLPLVVKPAQGGAAMGVRIVPSAAELSAALVTAYSYHSVALVERFVQGREVAVSFVDGNPLPPVEIVPRMGVYDYAARYTAGATEFFIPARLDSETLRACVDAAAVAWRLLGCRHLMRADMIVDDAGTPWLLELDTCPGLTETSLLPLAAEADGLPFPSLCQRVLELALADAPAATAVTR